MINEEIEKKIFHFLSQLESISANKITLSSLFSKISNPAKIINSWLEDKKKYEQLNQELIDYQALQKEESDPISQLLCQNEIKVIKNKKILLFEKIKREMLKEENSKRSVLMEIRPGTGGVEAGLFARDLYRMYYKLAEKKKWQVEMIESKVDFAGNFTFVSFLVKGQDSYIYLKQEAGVHRVQRVPATENKGRVHTSTATVVVLPEAQEIELEIRQADLKIETCRSSGAGGQHVNTTDSAVKVTHIPTKITAISQDGRSQHDNREKALFVLRSRLLEKYQQEQAKEIGDLRSLAIGSSKRSEKIRTYTYPQNRLTDHRVGSWNKLNFMMEGGLWEVCEELIDYEIEQKVDFYQKLIAGKKTTN